MIETEMDFPYIVGDFASQRSIRKKLHLTPFKGICPSKFLNGDIVVFMSAHDPKQKKVNERDKSNPSSSEKFWSNLNFRNIYHDSYNDSLGEYLYTGEGQQGDQTLSRGNKRLANAKNDAKKIHFFRQYIPESSHQYIGEVEVSGFEYDIQEDGAGKHRKVIIFHLTPISNKSISTRINSHDDAISREIESELSTNKKLVYTPEELDEKIKKLNLKILKAGPKKGHISNTKTPADFQRNKQMVDLLKSKHTKCMICKIPNFEKISGALYSEASHIIPWVTSHNDSSENIIILCPTCHKKFDEAKITERQKMYKELTDNFPNTKFEKPEWM